MSPRKFFHLHLVSDSTGETVSSVSRAALAQFEGVEHEEHIWSLVRTPGQMEKVIAGIKAHPGVVLYTLVDEKLHDMIHAECKKRNLPCIPVIAPVVSELGQYLGVASKARPGKQHELDEEYFLRVEAINYTLSHDDGQSTQGLENADIILVGVSRTSKSPTCVYLANKGYKVANVPFVYGCPLPDNLETLTGPLIVGLTIATDRLLQIRKSRLQAINHDKDTNYVDVDLVQKEIAESRKLFHKHRWPIIDVTRKSVEETAATIVQYYTEHRNKAGGQP